MSGRTACCGTCGAFHEPHCPTTIPVNVYPPVHGFIQLPIDWERVRIDAAIAAMQGMLACGGWDSERLANVAVCHADALLAELKKEETK